MANNQTIYRQTSSSSESTNQENIRRKCKGIGGISWDEVIIQEGIVVCKRTGELVGFENLEIPMEITNDPCSTHNENDESDIYESEFSDSESDETSSTHHLAKLIIMNAPKVKPSPKQK